MKHSILTYSMLAAMIALPSGCVSDQAPAKPAPAQKQAAKAPAPKKLDPASQRRAEEQAKRKAEAEAKKKIEDAYRAQNQALSKTFDGLYKKRMTYAARIDETKKLLQDPLNADPRLQLRICEQIIRYCQQPPWTHISEYDYSTANTEIPATAQKVINDSRYTLNQKLFSINALALHYCDRQMFDKAEQLLKQYINDAKTDKREKTNLLCTLANVYRLQDKYSQAMSTCRDAMKINPEDGARTGADIALSFDKLQDAIAIWDETKDEYRKLNYFGNRRAFDKASLKPNFKKEALAFIKDTKNKPDQRLAIAQLYLFDNFGTKEESDLRKSLYGIPAQQKKAGGWWIISQVKRPFQLGDYPLMVEICELYAGSGIMNDLSMQKIHVISLGAMGRKAEAAKFAVKYGQNEKLKPVDQMRFKFYEAILSGKSTDGLLKTAKLTRKEQSEVLLSAARQCLTWGMSDLAEKYSAEYDKYFAEKPDRKLTVKYFDTPINSISDWRKIYKGLDKQVCDIKFQGSMDFLETDVATGSRSINIDKNSKNTDRMEVSTACDERGLHVFLLVKTDKARQIEHGFANGIGTEMYFAPGRNQPYVCMGSEPTKGITFMFQTTYDNLNHKRPNQSQPKTSFRDEIEFTDTDYVLHMFFAWDDYYNKLPVNGTEYRFECISWCPDGGFSFGGSQGVHSASSWGTLKFELTDKQINKIRKNLIFRYYKGYKMVKRDPATRENLFDIWADSEIGDPDFFKTKLLPLQKELDGYAARVKADMSDADVADIYANALPRWIGLPHEIDLLRRQYLEHQMLPAAK